MDLHIHTCLSPCGDPESVPTRIVAAALQKGIDAVAVCDHNATENVAAVVSAAEKQAAAAANGITQSPRQHGVLTVFGGMEITSREEIHLLALFDDFDALADLQALVYGNLPGEYDGEFFGEQYIVDDEDYVTGYNRHLLMGATELSVDRLVEEIHLRGGLAVASHVDRGAFSLISQLGFVPPEGGFDALELSCGHRERGFDLSKFSPGGRMYPGITSSDAHHPRDIGRGATDFFVEAPRLKEIGLALAGEEGRRFEMAVPEGE